MNDSFVKDICQKTIEPLSEKLNVLVERLVSKDDLKELFANIQNSVNNQISDCLSNLQNEFKSRDERIASLEIEVESLKQSNTDLKNIVIKQIEKVENIESDARDRLNTGPQINLDPRNESFVPSEDAVDYQYDTEVDDEEEEEEKESIDFLCLGDSLVRWLCLENIYPGFNNKLVCRPGATIASIRSTLKELDEEYSIKKKYF